MRIKPGIIIEDICGMKVGVTSGEAAEAFSGVLNLSETAATIIQLLADDHTEESLVEAMAGRYDAPREVIAADVARFLAALRSRGLLAE